VAKDTPILDFSDPGHKRMALALVRGLEGLHWFEVRRCKSQRSLDQNAYMWAEVLPAIARGISQQWGETVTAEEAHEFCKSRFLSRPIVDRRTGELKGYTRPSTSDLDTAEFAEYLDKLILFAAEYLNTEVKPPRTEVSA